MTDGHEINEQTLIDSLSSGSVHKIMLIQGADRKYTIKACLSWKGGGQTLVTQRKKARVWASLDRLIKHMETKYQNVPVIELHLYKDSYEHPKSSDC